MTASLVLGLGNVLMGDDGAGVHTVERLRTAPNLPEEVSLIDGGTLSFTLLEMVESVDALIVIDAMELQSPPGSVRTLVDDQLDEFLGAPVQRNIHDVSLGDLLRMCALRGTVPGHRALIGIQPGSIEWRDRPTPAVANGIEEACRAVNEMIEEWAHGDG